LVDEHRCHVFPASGVRDRGTKGWVSLGLFGEFEVRIDPWQVDYGPEVAADGEPGQARETVQQDVEIARGQWRPIRPVHATWRPALVFVDGVRRVEARIQIPHRQHGIVYGAFGSYAVGGVHVEDGAASFRHVTASRVVATAAGVELPAVVRVMPGADYRPIHAAEADVDAPLRRIQQEMRQAEETLARRLAQAGEVLVVADGPLTFQSGGGGQALGYVKRVSEWYIADPAWLATLPQGARTPLFEIHARQRFARYAWFVRMAEPWTGDSPMSGIVRLEVSATDADLDSARALADATAIFLPRFASARVRDPRAPQNLAPIGALEFHLRHAMGDAVLLRRQVEAVVRREAARV
jgi:hypothetical protein